MVESSSITCPRCAAKVHNQKALCHNCGYALVPADSTRPPLRGRAPVKTPAKALQGGNR